MEFNKKYNRSEFVGFLQHKFLPEDFVVETTAIGIKRQTKYIRSVTKLGSSKTLDLVVYEILHVSAHDARVGLTKEAFRFLADEWENKALVLFVPKDNDANYRFSLITIDLCETEEGKLKKTYSNPRRYSYYLGEGIAYYTPNKYLNASGRVTDEKNLTDRFSVEVLTKAFYQELSDWYAWAVKVVRFPNKLDDKDDDDKFNSEAAIRLVTRLIFVWFLKQKHLIPDEFFDENYIRENLIDGFNPNANESKYYKAILQNLFFAMLNSPITKEGESELSERRFRSGGDENDKLMCYESMFKNPKLFIELANCTVPFLNGGLFDCLDDKDKGNYVDGFSDCEAIKKALIVPDYLFFGEEVGKNIDLSGWYGDKKKKEVSARGIIDILKRYNFTVEENTPFDQEVSLDPELLGKVFENLLASYNPETQTTARKQTGSFYTPRDIVQYMVDESLVAHLKRTVGDGLEAEYRKLVSYVEDDVMLTDEQKLQVMESIYHCKVLDPACGSGAFPVGMLQQMVHILSKLDPSNKQWRKMMLDNAVDESRSAFQAESKEECEERLLDIKNSFDENLNNPDYARKLYLIENCIYGVDIQPIAIQISKLRFFISLVVDQKSNNDPVKNFGIRPLPNLEAKFVAANSLVPLQEKENSLAHTDVIIALENSLKEANHKIFSAKPRTKRKWEDCLKELRREMIDELKDLNFSIDAVNQRASWDMFNQNAAASFFDANWMFGIKDGFDIVIGNPPYIQLQNNGGELAKLYGSYGYKTFAKTGDIYCLFYERGWQLLKSNGHLCYITSNKWMRAGYGEKIRDFFAKNANPRLLIDFAGVKIFESATVDTNILLLSRTANQHETVCAVTHKQNKDSVKNLSIFVQRQGMKYDFASSDMWVILSPIEQDIKRKIEAVGTPLKDWNINIYRGILTGCNDAFIIKTAKREEILANCRTEDERQRTEKLIRPILQGRDIKRHGYEWAGQWLINTHNGVQGIMPRINIKDYPAVKRHLDQHWDEIKSRTDQGDTPYNLRNCAYMEDFNKPKLIYPETTQGAFFAYDDDGMFIDKTCFMMITEYANYIQATLSSQLFEFAYKRIFSSIELGQNGFQYNKHALIKLPIKKFNEDNSVIYSDDFFYNQYGITEEEIEYIERFNLSDSL